MNISTFISRNAIWKGLIPMFSSSDAIKLIELCENENKKILGIDVFLFYSNSECIRPLLEESIDYSLTKESTSDNWKKARDFIISKKQKEYYYEIVYDD